MSLEIETGCEAGDRADAEVELRSTVDAGGEQATRGDRLARLPQWAVAVGVGLAALLVYWRTLSASIPWGDSPELTAAAYTGGVPHPTGYPLYMLLSHWFLHHFPFGSIAYRMNLLSALSAAGAVALAYCLLTRITRSRIASLIVALSFAFSLTFWSQAVIAEVYAFHLLGLTALLLLLLTWDARGERRWLRLAALTYGLCFTHHLMSLLLLPGLLLFALTSRRRGQFLGELRWCVPLFLLPLCLYLYLPLAAWRDSPLNWGDPRSWNNFLAHVTGKQYRSAMFHVPHGQIVQRLKDYSGIGLTGRPGFLLAQFGGGMLWLAPLGAWSLLRRRWRLFALTMLIYLVDVAYALNYYIYDVEVYYLPSHLMVAVWIAAGLRQLGIWLAKLWRRIAMPPVKRRPLNAVLGTALLIMPLSLLSANWGVNDHHDDWSALMYARAALDALKPNALLLSGDDNYYFPLLYSRFVENRRPDVALTSFYDVMRPERARLTTRLAAAGVIARVPPRFGKLPGVKDDNRFLKRLVTDNVGRRPVYLLARPDALNFPWLKEVVDPFYRIVDSNVPNMELTRRGPRLAVHDPRPQQPRRVAFGPRQPDGRTENGLEFLGYDLKPRRENGIPWLKVSYYWRVRDQAMSRPAKVWVVFTDADGNYKRNSDGSPEFHNIHPLAYGLGVGKEALPPVLRETFDVYVPPQVWNKRLHMRIAVALGETFLPTSHGRDPWVEVGEVPVATPDQRVVKMAAKE